MAQKTALSYLVLIERVVSVSLLENQTHPLLQTLRYVLHPAELLRKQYCVECFPCVCPEPVLVN
jgi:hypothetical protein